MAVIKAEWAVWGISPETGGAYTVLAHSEGRLRASHFETIITRFSPGTPDGEAALPRLTIGTVEVSKVPHLGLALQTQEPGHLWEASTTRFFFFPFQALGEARSSYSTLYEHLSGVELPEAGTGPLITIDPPAFDPAAVPGTPWEAEPDPALAAALLVRGRRLCITQAEEASLEERLRFLDEVTAWLPYGYRAKLTATTWANSATPHRLRLFFARHAAGHGVMELPWSGRLTPDPLIVQEHLLPLRRAVERLGAAAVIGRLAADTAPRSCDDPGPAVRTLEEMAHSFQVPGAEADLEELRASFDCEPILLDAQHRAAACRALARLIEKAEPQDWPTIERWWRELADEDVTTLLTALLGRCRRLLWSGERTGITEALPLAYQYGTGDDFLASLVTPPDGPERAAVPGARHAARLVHDSVLVSGDTRGHPRTLRAVLENPLLLCAFIARLGAGGRSAEGLRWLSSAPHGDSETLLALWRVLAAEDPQPPAPELLWRLNASGRDCLAVLLEGAAESGRLHLVLRPFGEMLATGRIPAGDFPYWAERLGSLSSADPSLARWTDALLSGSTAHLGDDPLPGSAPSPGRTADLSRGTAAIAEELPPLQGAEAVVYRLCTGYRRGLSLDTCLRRLGDAAWKPTPALAVAVVRGLAPALLAHGATAETAQAWSTGLAQRLARGDFGRKLARRFRRELLTAAIGDIGDRLALVSAVAGEGPPLTGGHRLELQSIHAELGRLLEQPPAGQRPQPTGRQRDPDRPSHRQRGGARLP
ncbi:MULTISPECIES: hypothetical protein [Thermomonospora]|uniref:Uncharacterized protein n=1 Tax=Thermomonospora curvata (strain ATCC 19995 / DSM 43183 / JCM 3096 / KCTC 9072 / NBRC 15933 / NCIMB 10081 / Henssen B9) TaxID=471852 RepID=D1A9D0_THECD|nr:MULTISPECIES: hypothetical protein [Thermomonospora]ACY96826.1 hypothetical protein Tcur_1243 [Thermomonospora curvata DSM 43183]PKK15120.1 MAG: hypothetical protein BUE48_006055 [Thermomonospora sp. CIF 1]